jgi:hypothetical protein
MSRLINFIMGAISDAVPSLPLVVLRIGFVYGPYVEFGLCEFTFLTFLTITRLTFPTDALVITVASIYGYMNKPMKTP